MYRSLPRKRPGPGSVWEPLDGPRQPPSPEAERTPLALSTEPPEVHAARYGYVPLPCGLFEEVERAPRHRRGQGKGATGAAGVGMHADRDRHALLGGRLRGFGTFSRRPPGRRARGRAAGRHRSGRSDRRRTARGGDFMTVSGGRTGRADGRHEALPVRRRGKRGRLWQGDAPRRAREPPRTHEPGSSVGGRLQQVPGALWGKLPPLAAIRPLRG